MTNDQGKKKSNLIYIIILIVTILIVSLVLLLLLTPKNSSLKKNPFSLNFDEDLKLADSNIYYNSNRVAYNNTSSGMSSNTIQDAIDELYAGVMGDCYVGYTKGTTTSSQYTCNKKPAASSTITDFNGSDVSYDNSNGITANNIQAAIDELASHVSWCNTNYEKENVTSNSYDCVIQEFTVTYDYSTNGGTSSTKTSDSVLVNTAIDLTPTATKSGWTFVGWNTDQNATVALSSLTMSANDVTLYAIYRKEAVTRKVKFNLNGNNAFTYNSTRYTTDTEFDLCTIQAVYNNATQSTSCTGTITLATLEGASGFTVKGWHTSSTDTSSPTYTSGQANVSLTTDGTYNLYGQSEKAAITHTATFNVNGNGTSALSTPTGCTKNSSTGVVTCSCTIAATYNGTAQGTSCSITNPTITAPSNTPTVCGYTTSTTGTTSCSVASGGSLTLTSNPTYYAQTYKSAITHTATFYKNGANKQTNASGTAVTDNTVTRTCTRATTYNGTAQASSCSITSPTITPTSGYEVVGYNTTSTATTSSWNQNTQKTGVTSNLTYYAITKLAPICIRATSLHTETCSQSSNYCYADGYYSGGTMNTTTITYGKLGTSGNTPAVGDAFDCNVDGTGYNQRFYYVSPYYNTDTKTFDGTTSEDYATLIYYSNTVRGVANAGRSAYDSSNENWHGPVTAKVNLPTTTQWSNITLKTTERKILACSNSDCNGANDPVGTNGSNTIEAFSYSGYAARLLTLKELKQSGCDTLSGKTSMGNTGALTSCNFLMEGTKYADNSKATSGTWLETPRTSYSYSVWDVNASDRYVRGSNASSTVYGARPAIDVQMSRISY